MSHLPPGGICPSRRRSIAARIRVSFWARCVALIRIWVLGVVVGCGRVDLVQDATCSLMVGLQANLLDLAGRAEAAQEGLGRLGMLGPDVAVTGVVGGLWACLLYTSPSPRDGLL